MAIGRPERVGRRPGPGFWFVAPAVFLLILIGLLPFVWSVVGSSFLAFEPQEVAGPGDIV